MKIVLLAGGEGKRMRPILKDKCLLKFCGKELILHQLELLKEVGLTDVVLIASFGNIEQLKSICGDAVQYAIQRNPKGMADALLSAETLIGDSEFLVMNANDIFELDAFKKIISLASSSKADACLLGFKVKDYFPGGYLMVDGNKINGIVEKPGKGNEPSDLVNIVLHYHRTPKVLFEYLKKAVTDNDDRYEVAMDNMMKKYDYRVVPYSGAWVAIKFPWQIHNAMEYFIKKQGRSISKNTNISDKANIIGDVIIEDGVRVFENTTIRGPCYIGKNVVVGNNSLIWNNTHICANSVVGYSSEVKHSYIGENCWFHMDYVGDSVIMDGTSFGAGTVTANFRFDEKNIKVNRGVSRFDTYTNKFGCIIGEGCKTGINVSILPGITIGANSIIGPHVHLNTDLGSNKFIYLTQAQTTKVNPISVDQAKKDELMRKLKEKVK